ncbi:MAG: hypothetical protein KKA97_04585 [Actinobacteria bacterium]|nr:hypothetical protein [Actinomycetota bacterium]
MNNTTRVLRCGGWCGEIRSPDMARAKVDLGPFCRKGKHRYAIGEPFVQGGYLYATDGVMAVRMPTRRKRDTRGALPQIGLVFRYRGGRRKQWPWSGEEQEPILVDEDERGGLYLARWRARLIAALPEVEWLVLRVDRPPHSVRFVFRGGEGVVMLTRGAANA